MLGSRSYTAARKQWFGYTYLAQLPLGATLCDCAASVDQTQVDYKTKSPAGEYITAFESIDPDYYFVDSDFDKDNPHTELNAFQLYTRTTWEIDAVIPTENVKGCIVRYFDTSYTPKRDDQIIVQIATEGNVVNKEALKEELDKIPTDGYYSSGDTWNGKRNSTNGFWNDMINASIVVNAKDAYENANSQAVVDDAKNALAAGLPDLISNLIPDTQVLPVKIHDALVTYKSLSDEDKAKYSAKSVQKYENARAAAVAAYDTLFDSEGNAIVETNKAERQEEIDAVADALEAAYNDLLGKTSEADIERWLAASEWAASQTIVEDHFTAESVNDLNAAIQAAKAIEDAHDDTHDILASKTEYQAYTDAVAGALCAYYQLENAGPISVHVRIVDNYGITNPEYAIYDSEMAHFDGNVTLTDHKDIQGLFLENEGGLYTFPKTEYKPRTGVGGIDDTCEHAHTYVYVNGKLAIPAMQADPTALARMNPSAGHMDVYSDKDLSVGGYYPSDGIYENIEDRFPVLKNALHDGDDVVVLRTRAPYMHYYQSGVIDRCLSNDSDGSRHVPLSAYYDSFGFLNIDESKTQNLIQINDCPLRGVA